VTKALPAKPAKKSGPVRKAAKTATATAPTQTGPQATGQ
jgi:hypothetical protein